MQVIKRGAEAVMHEDKFDGQKVLVKDRITKNYRIQQIDERVRKERTKQEVKLLTEVRKLGVDTPKIFDVDYEANKIFMEFVEGQRVKEFLQSAGKKEMENVMREIGKSVGKMHAADIVHGDLTTSNIIFNGKHPVFIDFGLGSFSKRLEDKAVDLSLFREALSSTHFKILKTCWENFLKGYRTEYADADKVLLQLGEIERRGRYMRRGH